MMVGDLRVFTLAGRLRTCGRAGGEMAGRVEEAKLKAC